MRWQFGVAAVGLTWLAALPAEAGEQGDLRVPALLVGEQEPPDQRSGAAREQAVLAPLGATEAESVRLAEEWKDGRGSLARGEEGRVTFTYGAAMPSLICAPLYVCDLELEPGEVVRDVHIGDAVRWKVQPAMSGEGEASTTHVIIKPTQSGLATNLLITTDRRTYTVKLLSRDEEWMPRVSFAYPENEQLRWAAYAESVSAQRQKQQEQQTLPTGQEIVNLDFEFRLSGDRPAWRPLRVYSDGAKTYIEFPPGIRNGEAPALLALGPGDERELVNFRMSGSRYIVDRVLARAVLVSGVGKRQERVTIEHRAQPAAEEPAPRARKAQGAEARPDLSSDWRWLREQYASANPRGGRRPLH